jgi:hypothetical protein
MTENKNKQRRTFLLFPTRQGMPVCERCGSTFRVRTYRIKIVKGTAHPNSVNIPQNLCSRCARDKRKQLRNRWNLIQKSYPKDRILLFNKLTLVKVKTVEGLGD